MYLQLADCNNSMAQNMDPSDFFLWVPDERNGGRWVREDLTDDLPIRDYQFILDNQPSLSASAAKKASRQARRDLRNRNKSVRIDNKVTGKTGFSNFIDTVAPIAGKVFGGKVPQAGVPEKGFQAGATYSKGNIIQEIMPLLLVGGGVFVLAMLLKKK